MTNIVNFTDISIERPEDIKCGQWFWVNKYKYDVCDDDTENPLVSTWLGCVSKVGSNFVEIKAPSDGSSYYSSRVHFDDIHKELRFEPEYVAIIQDKVQQYQNSVTGYLNELREITNRLGIRNVHQISDQTSESSTALATMSSQIDINGYKKELIEAKEVTIPNLIDQIAKSNLKLTKWMKAESLPYEIMSYGLKDNINSIDDRIFNVTLYAGLCEDIHQCSKGEPAPYDTKLRVMQRRLYMDEECLLNYKIGGMEFKDIHTFDDWLVKPENRNRILPYDRCIVAMQVRRNKKERKNGPSLMSSYINFNLAKLDKLTFLFIRNGENVYRMNTELNFGEMIFPDKSIFDPDEPKMVKMWMDRVDKMIPKREYDALMLEREEENKKYNKWKKENPDENSFFNPHRHYSHTISGEWKPFDDTNLYFDECKAEIASQIKKYNRIALIIQGLFDRSEILHPHAPVKSWTSEGFDEAIELVYDGSTTLYDGDAPDFEAYRELCNSSITQGSVTIGQEIFWERKEAEKECARMDNNWRYDEYEYRPERFRPEGNHGPRFINRIDKWRPNVREAIFVWHRERIGNNTFGDKPPIRTTLTVPATELFNVSAYKKGDYKQFFQDPRTRAQYLKWAHLLISAEEYLAGNLTIQEDYDDE